MPNLEVKGLTVTLSKGLAVFMSPQEAFNLLMMPSMAGVIVSMIPEYGLPSVPEPENKD